MMAVDMEHDTDLEFDLKIMALTVWAEARGEPKVGQRAVAWVIRNRFEHPGWWSRAMGVLANTIAAVCLCPFQFSCWNDNDPNRQRLEDQATKRRGDFLDIRALCFEVLHEPPMNDPTAGADHYCTKAVAPRTKWAQRRTPVATIGNHLFYRIGLQGEER